MKTFMLGLIALAVICVNCPGQNGDYGHYIDNGDGTITDTNTHLMWTKTDSLAATGQRMNWNEAKAWVDGLTTGGHTDWRLPTIAELKTIYDEQYSIQSGIQYSIIAGGIGERNRIPIHVCPLFQDGGAVLYWSGEDAGSGRSRGMAFSYGDVYGVPRVCSDGIGGARGVRSSGR